MSASYEQLKGDYAKLLVELIAAEIRGMERARDMAFDYENVTAGEWAAKYGDVEIYQAIQAEIDALKKLQNEREKILSPR